MYKKTRLELCAINAPWWPKGHTCYLYRYRNYPLGDGGWESSL